MENNTETTKIETITETSATNSTVESTIVTTPATKQLTARLYMKPSAEAVEYLRLIVPKELRGLVKKPALWRSLKTSDKAEALASAAPVAVAFHEFMQELVTEHLGDNAPEVNLSTEIKAENFVDLMEKADSEDISVIKADLRKSFFQEPKTSKKSAPVKQKLETAVIDPSASKRLQSFKRKRKTRRNGRNNDRRN